MREIINAYIILIRRPVGNRPLRDPGVDGRIFKCILGKYRMEGYGFDSSGPG
jgi:hypothetical protein